MLTLIIAVVAGTVTGASSRWSGDVIITETRVRDETGSTTTVLQLGGSVDGLGMIFADQPAPSHIGHTVALDEGTATYGVQRTARSGKPLWRASGCIELVYDAN